MAQIDKSNMRAYLTLRCSVCENVAFRSIGAAEAHILEKHGSRQVPYVEWIGLPANIYKGGDPIVTGVHNGSN